ncbi:hypothetical protein DIPPA_17014 [Diplonema papillatum]|nr:hypothetical protein DIPPA_17014 [Diplonema papillatum]
MAAQTAIFKLVLRLPEGKRLHFDANSHDTISGVKKKIVMKLSGVVFEDEALRRTVELYTYGNGLHCTIDGVRWDAGEGEDTGQIGKVEMDGRLLRLGGKEHGGVTIPKLSKAAHQKLMSRIRDTLEAGRVAHNVPPPMSLHRDKERREQKPAAGSPGSRTELTLLSGEKAAKFAHDAYVHTVRCSGNCGSVCFPGGQPTQSWGALVRGAAARGDMPELKRLIASGAPLEDGSDATGMTPLHHAARYGHAAAVKLLLEAGCYALSLDSENRTPHDYAARQQDRQVIDLLARYAHPTGSTFSGVCKGKTSPGVFADAAEAQNYPRWVLKDLRQARPGEMTDLSSQPWAPGIPVTVLQDVDKVESLCRSSWAGWGARKSEFVGQRGTVMKVRTSEKLVLLEVLFDTNDRYWFPGQALVSPFGKGEERDVIAGTVTQQSAEAETKWRLVFSGKDLEDWETLWQTGVADGDTVHLLKASGGYSMWGAASVSLDGSPSRPPRDAVSLPTGLMVYQ